MQTGTQSSTLPGTIKSLREITAPGDRVLSVYLDTSPGRIAGQAYLLAYRDACKAPRETLPTGERDAFEAAAAQAERHLTQLVPGRPGLALFASGSADYLFAAPLPTRPVEEIAWAKAARLGPLVEVLDEFERLAVLLFDKERAILSTIFLGEIEGRHALEDDVPGKQATGGWFALAQTRYARHHEEHVLRHAKRTIALLMEVLRDRPFDRLFLAGPDEAVELLTRHLPRPLKARMAGRVALELFADEAAIRKAALAAAEAVERRDELALVDELLNEATATRAAVGVQATLDALNDRRVHVLFVADSLSGPAAECRRCERLSITAGRCPLCGGPLAELADLRERVFERALEQGARIESLAGPAAAKLAGWGGLGAWTRY
jgi:peptide subunit release factor 1 (eRF1)